MNIPDSADKNAEIFEKSALKTEDLPDNSDVTESVSVPTDWDSVLSQLEAAKREVEKYKDLALRTQAELDNYRKRTIREKEDTIRYANAAILERLLPILDSFELGLEAAKNASEPSSIAVGMEMVKKQFLDFLKDNGMQHIETIGSLFDPNLHEAVGHEHSDQVQDGHIIRQLRSGYKLRDRLLRPSTVVVSKGAGTP